MNAALNALIAKWYPVYDVIFGLGIDFSTGGDFILQPNPGIAGSPGAARVIFYTPSGSDTGPTNVNAFGSTFATYTRTTMAKCKALQRTVASTLNSRPSGYGDWVLFPSGTVTFPVNGETYWGEAANVAGASRQYPTIFGTYDSTDMTNPAKWNKTPCLIDFSAVAYGINTNGFFYNLGRFEGNIGLVCLQWKKVLATTIIPAYTANGARGGVFMQRCTMDGASVNITAINGGLASNGGSLQTVSAITAVGTTATATVGSLVTPNVLNAPGLMINFSGDTSGYYNGTHACTYLNSTQVTFTVPVAPPGPATGTMYCGVVTALLPDSISVTDVVFNQCGFGYYGSLTASHSINVQIGAACKRARFYKCVMVHGGWNRSGSRSALVYNPGTTKYPITSLTRSGTTVTALCPNTGTLHAGGFVVVASANYNTNSAITSFVANTSFTYEVDANGAPATMGGAHITGHLTGTSLTIDTLTDGVPVVGQLLNGPGITQCSLSSGSSFLASISGTTMTVTSAPGTLLANGTTLIGLTLAAGTTISSQLTSTEPAGALGGRGTYQVSISQTMASTNVFGTVWVVSVSQTVGSAGSPVAISICPYVIDPEANGSSWTTGAIPDVYSHGYYIENDTFDIKMIGCVTALDCVNSKFTGGPYLNDGGVDIRCPIAFITSPYGNDTTGNTWPSSTTFTWRNHLCLFSQDLDPGSPRSGAPWMLQPGVGSSYDNGLILNASNNLCGAASAASRTGPLTYPNTGGYSVYQALSPFSLAIRNTIIAGWGPTETTDYSGSGVTKTFAFNITEDSPVLPGGTNLQLSAAQSAFQVAITNTLALDIANTFRLSRPELAGVTVAPGTGLGQGLNNAANLQTEQNVLDFMMYHPWYPWADWLQAHFRQYLGR